MFKSDNDGTHDVIAPCKVVDTGRTTRSMEW
ncbi:hypothetical protein HMPREF0666_01430 [Prevotella sp. C561]|nr:hypothetical protein HMPREF0666_01430 [Prevotella sp. C561]